MNLINARNGTKSIELGNLVVDQKADNFLGKAALAALKIESKARGVLADPTGALNSYLTRELNKQDVKLEGIAMQFTSDDRFTVLLRGSSK